jgi:phosphate starvation-inducible membrane PsiE
MSVHDDHSRDASACAEPFSPMGLVIIGIIVFISLVLWQHGPSIGTLLLLPVLLICPLTHLLLHRHPH